MTTGRPVTVDYLQVLRLRDGKHDSFNLMYDRLLLLEQLGLMYDRLLLLEQLGPILAPPAG